MRLSNGNSSPRSVLIVSCLFILAAVAVQMWRGVNQCNLLIPNSARNGIVSSRSGAKRMGSAVRFPHVLAYQPRNATSQTTPPQPPPAVRVVEVPRPEKRVAVRITPPLPWVSEETSALSEPLRAEPPPPRPQPLYDAAGQVAQRGAFVPVPTDVPLAPRRSPTELPDRIAGELVSEPVASCPPRSPWPKIPALRRQLQFKDELAGNWAEAVLAHVDALNQTLDLNDEQAVVALHGLARLAGQVEAVAGRIDDFEEEVRLRSAGYALERRIEVWSALQRASAVDVGRRAALVQDVDPRVMSAISAALRDVFAPDAHGDAWAEFLLLGEIDGMCQSASFADDAARAELAARVLSRIAETELTEDQQEFLSQSPLVEFQSELRRWTTLPVDGARLLAQLEAYEEHATLKSGDELAVQWNRLRWSVIPEQVALATALNTHYRNANVRFAVTEEFINRLLPAIRDVQAPVRERILGAEVRGQSASRTQMRVRLEPDPSRIRMRLDAHGYMAAQTSSTKGAVTMYNRNRSRFLIQKLFLMDGGGLLVGRSRGTAQAHTNLTGMQTQYDSFPILGSMVRRIAAQRHLESRSLTQRIIERRLAGRASNRIDTEVDGQLIEARQRWQKHILDPLERLDLDPTAIAMSTTDDRLVLRGRLAGKHQLAAFTARPRAVAGNLVSFQVHESALNNLFDQLNLNGRTGDLIEIIEQLRRDLDMNDVNLPADLPQGVIVSLAEQDAVRVRFEADRVSLTLRFATLTSQRGCWRNFAVRADYVPRSNGFQCELHRDKYIQLTGRRLSLGDQLALRGIFTKVLSKNRPLKLVHPELAQDTRLADLNVSQFTIRNGWIGVSIGTVPDQVEELVAERHTEGRR